MSPRSTPRPKPKSRWPRWVERADEINLREVAPNLYVGGQFSPLEMPTGKKWELVVDFYGKSAQYPSRVRDTAKKLLALPFLDGDRFPPGALTRALQQVRAARRRGPVLIQCQAGLSRSASAAYGLMRRIGRLSHAVALKRVKCRGAAEFPREATLASAREWVEKAR